MIYMLLAQLSSSRVGLWAVSDQKIDYIHKMLFVCLPPKRGHLHMLAIVVALEY